jgi:hypothetical protein
VKKCHYGELYSVGGDIELRMAVDGNQSLDKFHLWVSRTRGDPNGQNNARDCDEVTIWSRGGEPE